ncbi:TetR/AcrR family transcriptional regulator [Tepidimonas sp.]|uniref:TetR/AcrR family transcriptional regulator n=1 Tax=Tepidimonas sp. TaxID=2002775 RepID=UPI002FE1D6FA
MDFPRSRVRSSSRAGQRRRGRPTDPAKDRAIWAAARALLRVGGPSALTMDRVARGAGVSKATLYRRYPNRAALLEAVVEQRTQHLWRTLRVPPDEAWTEWRPRLQGFVEALLALLCGREYRQFIRALAGLPQPAGDVQRLWRLGPQRALHALSEFLRQAHRAGQLHCPDAELAAEQLLGLTMGLDLVRSLYHVPQRRWRHVDRRTYAAQVVAIFWQGYAPAHTAASRPFVQD